MISTRWLEKRKPHWDKLEKLLDQSAKGGLKSLSRSDLQELSLAYRQIAADLAAIREDPASVHFARYINQLLVRAHNTIYSGRRASPKALFFVLLGYLSRHLPPQPETLPLSYLDLRSCRTRGRDPHLSEP